jgi:hypothetical protein
MKIGKKEIIKLIVIIALAAIMCGGVYVLSNNKKINLPKMGEIEEVLIKIDNRNITISDKKEIEKIYKIIENKKSMKKSVTDTPKDVKKLTKISFIIGDDEKNIMNIYMKDNMYYLEQPYNGIFKLSKNDYEDIMMYLSRVYTIGEMSKFNVTNNKIMMEIKNDEMKDKKETDKKEEMKSENMMTNKIKLIIKNMTKKTYEYEEDFYVEMEKDGKWYEVKWTEEPSFNLILHVIKGEETITTEIDGMFRESLTKGKYRIVKSFTEENASEDTEIVYSAVEFEVK